MAYSLDFRKKVITYCERTRNISEAAKIFHQLTPKRTPTNSESSVFFGKRY